MSDGSGDSSLPQRQRLCVWKLLLGTKSLCAICEQASRSLEGLPAIFNVVTSLSSKPRSFLISQINHYGCFLFRRQRRAYLRLLRDLYAVDFQKDLGPAPSSDTQHKGTLGHFNIELQELSKGKKSAGRCGS